MIVLLSPARSGGTLIAKILKELTGKPVHRTHLAQYTKDGKHLKTDGKDILLTDIEYLFFVSREPLENAASKICFDNFSQIQEKIIYQVFLNSCHGAQMLAGFILLWLTHSWTVFSKYKNKKYVIQYKNLINKEKVKHELASLYQFFHEND